MDMSPIPNAWEVASLVCKLFFYIGAASAFGGSVSLWLYGDGSRRIASQILSYQLIGGLLGFNAVIVNFLVQVGLVNNAGIAAAFDWTMAQILLDTALGDLSLYRLVGFVLIIVASALQLRLCMQLTSAPSARFYLYNLLGVSLGFLLILYSFRFGGHVSVLGLQVQLALAFHFIAFAYWIGALYPLLQIARGNELSAVQMSLKRFGDHAIALVIALIAAGLLMLINLIHEPVELIETSYGRSLLIKLLLVIVLLGIAALNRLRLVPELERTGSSMSFCTSVKLEMAVALLLLVTTAYLSTIVGPMSHAM